ncbi:hypothetical protein L2E82_34446 [Cichorium intybus]|uniref:Uncharacterized protein n=1 Tax=Cichorium intybus TaxID=13427 RepID=A0ACB9BMG6_CICIN|nr:hypothetical protein L2E82_34446 [Cichorium intybus]
MILHPQVLHNSGRPNSMEFGLGFLTADHLIDDFRCCWNCNSRNNLSTFGCLSALSASPGIRMPALENIDCSELPERPSEPPCIFYMKTGKCKFGSTCKFLHPKDITITTTEVEDGNGEAFTGVTGVNGNLTPSKTPFAPAMLHNSKGLPIRPGELDCPFYLKTGSCKYGGTCRYNHPERFGIDVNAHDILFVEDSWESPVLGAWGLD